MCSDPKSEFMNTQKLPGYTTYVIIFLILLVIPSSAHQTGKGTSLRSRLERYLIQQADSGFCFSALIAIDGKVVLQEGFGWIDSSRTIRATQHTLFNIASITKSITATAVIFFIDRKHLALNDELTKIF